MKIKDLKVGDHVIFIDKVVRVTQVFKRHLYIEGEPYRFSRATGWALGMDAGHYEVIELATTDRVIQIEETHRRNALFTLGVNRLRSIQNVFRLAEIVSGITE